MGALEACEDVPWVAVQDVSRVLQVQPSILVGEVLFISCALLCLVHALANSRWHVSVWVAALVSGCVNDLFFMALEFVDNFFHTQCTLMITPRFPVYIPCVYIVFVYVSCVAAERVHLRWVFGNAGIAGLVGALFYAPYDLVGAKHLWWTWHDTDAGVRLRWLGVPIGSTMWTVVHCGVFALLLVGARRHRVHALVAVVAASLLTTPVMMAAMGFMQLSQLDVSIDQRPGMPDLVSLCVAVAVCAAAAAVALLAGGRDEAHKKKQQKKAKEATGDGRRLDALLYLMVVVYGCTLVAVMALSSPESIRSEGAHQTRGECGVMETDPLSNYSREKYLCAHSFDEDFSLCGDPLCASWYPVCGRAHTNRPLYVAAAAALAAGNAVAYGALLLVRGRPAKAKAA